MVTFQTTIYFLFYGFDEMIPVILSHHLLQIKKTSSSKFPLARASRSGSLVSLSKVEHDGSSISCVISALFWWFSNAPISMVECMQNHVNRHFSLFKCWDELSPGRDGLVEERFSVEEEQIEGSGDGNWRCGGGKGQKPNLMMDSLTNWLGHWTVQIY